MSECGADFETTENFILSSPFFTKEIQNLYEGLNLINPSIKNLDGESIKFSVLCFR